MVQRAPYSYSPIQLNQFRLVKFVHHEAHTSAVLKTFSVKEPHPAYYALTYTWDNNARSWCLEIEDQLLPALDSVEPFIQALRCKGALSNGRWWWIDSICIDQTNVEERAQQVQLITESRKDQVIKRFSNPVFDLRCLICGTYAPYQKSPVTKIPHSVYIILLYSDIYLYRSSQNKAIRNY
jgi:hypothetical protein